MMEFKVSRGWLEKFIVVIRYLKKTSVAQKEPDKLVFYIIHVRRGQEKQKYEFAQIIAINESPVWSDIVS